jgi:hypothetical protein
VAYRLYDERNVPQLGDWWETVTGGINTAISYAQNRQAADAAEASAEAQRKAVKAQTELTKQQTLLQQAQSAVTKHPVATGTVIALVGGAAVLAFLLMRKK